MAGLIGSLTGATAGTTLGVSTLLGTLTGSIVELCFATGAAGAIAVSLVAGTVGPNGVLCVVVDAGELVNTASWSEYTLTPTAVPATARITNAAIHAGRPDFPEKLPP